MGDRFYWEANGCSTSQ